MAKDRSVIFLVPFPRQQAPSQRFRLELYEPYLHKAGIRYSVLSFLDTDTSKRLYKKGQSFRKAWGIVRGFLRRFKHVLIDIHRYRYVYVLRQAAPIGPPLFEWLIARVFRKQMIYDFDDALWITQVSEENRSAEWMKCSWKIKYICKWAYKVSAGNEYLSDYARQYSSSVFLIPTCVDIDRRHNAVKVHGTHKPVVGWTGTHSTLCFLKPFLPMLKELQQEVDFTFLMICNKKPDLDFRDWRYIEWNEQEEVTDLLKMDIGIMPLTDTPWTRGKCGFKIIQYFSLGIPAVASPVGVNASIIEHGVNGFICDSNNEWKNALRILIENHQLRVEMGSKGREKVLTHYSTRIMAPEFLKLFS